LTLKIEAFKLRYYRVYDIARALLKNTRGWSKK